MGSFMNDIFGGGKKQTNFKDLMRAMELEADMNRTNMYRPFGSWEWETGPDGKAGQRYTMDPGLAAGKEALMQRVGGDGSAFEGYSSPSGLKGLLDSRMQHQYERLGRQMPDPNAPGPGAGQGMLPPPPGEMSAGGPGGMPRPMPAPMPPGPQGPPPQMQQPGPQGPPPQMQQPNPQGPPMGPGIGGLGSGGPGMPGGGQENPQFQNMIMALMGR